MAKGEDVLITHETLNTQRGLTATRPALRNYGSAGESNYAQLCASIWTAGELARRVHKLRSWQQRGAQPVAKLSAKVLA